MNIDFLLVCGVTFSTVCLLLYDHLTLLIFYVGSVPILSSIWMFLMATAACKFIIITRSLSQTKINPFSVLSNKVCGGWGVCGVLEQRFFTHNLSSKRIGEHTCPFPGHCKFTTHFNSQNHFQRFGKLPSSPPAETLKMILRNEMSCEFAVPREWACVLTNSLRVMKLQGASPLLRTIFPVLSI